jgi:hypothetical protein
MTRAFNANGFLLKIVLLYVLLAADLTFNSFMDYRLSDMLVETFRSSTTYLQLSLVYVCSCRVVRSHMCALYCAE